MPSQASLNNVLQATNQNRANGTAASIAVRSNSNLELADAESVLHRIISGSIRHFDGEQVIDIPAREIAQCSVALVKVIERRRKNLGKADPAPVKHESKPAKRQAAVATPAPRPEPIVLPAPGI